MTVNYLLRYGVALFALWLVLLGASLLDDAQRASKEIAASHGLATVMVCHDGRIVRDGSTLLHRMTGNLFRTGHFVCTDWRLREV